MLRKIGFIKALNDILEKTPVLPGESISLHQAVGRRLFEDVKGAVDSPSVNASLKDGYAICSEDIKNASREKPVRLRLSSSVVAGGFSAVSLEKGTAIKVTTGAPIPDGSDAVLAVEYTEEDDGFIFCYRHAEISRNILPKGTDVKKGAIIAKKGESLHPAMIGKLAAAGISELKVFRKPVISVLGTGDEIVAPGKPLPRGKLYASNITETIAWLNFLGFSRVLPRIVKDDIEEITDTIQKSSAETDVYITSGGAWGSERDLILKVLDRLGWEGVFHRVRLGPGKAAGFGFLEGKPFYILPGGPPSHEAAFLLLALPGVMKMSGAAGSPFPKIYAELTDSVHGQEDWTQVIHIKLYRNSSGIHAIPIKSPSRLSSMAEKNGLLLLPEGESEYSSGSTVEVMVLGDIDYCTHI